MQDPNFQSKWRLFTVSSLFSLCFLIFSQASHADIMHSQVQICNDMNFDVYVYQTQYSHGYESQVLVNGSPWQLLPANTCQAFELKGTIISDWFNVRDHDDHWEWTRQKDYSRNYIGATYSAFTCMIDSLNPTDIGKWWFSNECPTGSTKVPAMPMVNDYYVQDYKGEMGVSQWHLDKTTATKNFDKDTARKNAEKQLLLDVATW